MGVSNGEILFLYEARLCNPNGDPDNENKPRLDVKTGRNLVSDVRLKRYFRDYIASKFGEDYVWVTKLGGEHVDATTRLARLLGKDSRGVTRYVKEHPKEVKELLKRRLVDLRLFGATVPVKAGEGERAGESMSFTGPVQFSWGFSLHPVELVDSSTITSVFSGRGTEYGNIGKDWRLYYSLIAFYGVVSGHRAEYTGMTEKDLKILDYGLWKALELQATTRSKVGQRPLLYLRVEHADSETLLGDLRRFLRVEWNDTIRELSDVKVDFSDLVRALKSGKVARVYVKCSEEFSGFCDKLKEELKGRVEDVGELTPEELKAFGVS